MDSVEFIGRVCYLRGMNKEGSKVKVGINYVKSFPKVSPETMVDYYITNTSTSTTIASVLSVGLCLLVFRCAKDAASSTGDTLKSPGELCI